MKWVFMLTFMWYIGIHGFALTRRALVTKSDQLRVAPLHGRKTHVDDSERGRRSRDATEDSRHSIILKQKVGRMLRDELTDIICSCDIKAYVYPDESLLRGVTISDIDLSPDLASAKVYISVLGNSFEKRQVYVWLCNNVGQVRYALAQRLRELRRLPEVTFSLADRQSAQYLNKVLDEISVANSGEKEVDGWMGSEEYCAVFE